MTISDEAFTNILHTCHEYALFRTQEQAAHVPRVFLKLEWKSGQPSLRLISENELSLFDKMMRFLGVGGCRLKAVVNFLQSEAFCSKLQNKPLSASCRSDVEATAFSLDQKIKKHNTRHIISQIYTKQTTLIKTLQGHLVDEKPRYEDAFHHPLKEGGAIYPRLRLEEVDAAAFEKRLIKGIEQGTIIISKEGKVLGAPDLDTDKLSLEKIQIRNRAYIFQELKHLYSKTSLQSKSLFLQSISEAKGLPLPDVKTIVACQEALLKKMLEVDQKLGTLRIQDFSQVRNLVHTSKREAHLEACGIAQEERIKWLSAFEAYRQFVDHLHARKNHLLEIVNDGVGRKEFPPLAKIRLCHAARQKADKKINNDLEMIRKKTVQGLATGQLTVKEFKKELLESSDELKMTKELIQALEESHWKKECEFYQRWGSSIKAEMIQGFEDPGEVLGRGVCWALSLRWAVEALKNPKAGSLLEMGKTFAKDRMIQAFYSQSINTNTFSEAFEKLKNDLGIQTSSTRMLSHSIEGREEIKSVIEEFINDRQFQTKFKGVAQMSFAWKKVGHATCLCCLEDKEHPENSRFQIHDPNFGTFVLHSKSDLAACFADLLTKAYCETMHSIRGTMFELS